ncbi:two-component system response regulator [bacterium (Candidatus Blackallbacteria) CG17_big_fil_post_rev_8_21_14_2_50_48_46]|uniref:Two-component system response regulator n=1 Tax=bacterium (Candidatus Blackallbacteria) CG17_big_fil_post_rev_8_21_14_2_50_48_46 TaxID=2014261 RepID=A0A2M7FXA9_9BACT|nr:MAG: two-component system response regulator [bacterium (Candidatus Blackallbacteria) CG18_big_fil_WC_8_21_14_2_50_49_26]PIW13890.1 MAG: two-component system response regulator [bacterium (Candidatus Blackallbacteria) CG17_big_fil_post_rev_8_21_14_2_50_48_46]PIW45116.1 MAG: two-component system response regulator [bacterium (Candidatus Blackallbacteria) CG13_big_fil_rev_8_21_14_2_50_49_14]
MSLKILVVDDAVVARKMIKRHLTGSPYEDATIIEATSGENGLELFDDSMGVVMSDWNMPGINGLDFVREIRSREQAWGRTGDQLVPIIMITTEGTAQKVNLAKDAGVNEYIVKPFSAAQLVEALNNVLE